VARAGTQSPVSRQPGLAVIPLTADTPANAETIPLDAAINSLPVAAENRTGYERTSFRHWLDEDKDSCNTRLIRCQDGPAHNVLGAKASAGRRFRRAAVIRVRPRSGEGQGSGFPP
jgi:hypothetical protein